MSKSPKHRDLFADRLRDLGPTLTPASRRVARFISENRAVTLGSSALSLAAKIGTSDATVVRAIQMLGFTGLPHLKRVLAANMSPNPANAAEVMESTLDETEQRSGHAIDLAIKMQRDVLNELDDPEARAVLQAAVAALYPARRILVFGLGPSAGLATYFATLLGRTGRVVRSLNTSGLALADQLLDLGAGDALLVLAYGRAYREVVTVFSEAKRLALPIVLVTDSLERSIARHADVVVPARRGRIQGISMHGATLIALEAVVQGLASLDGERTSASLNRLNELRAAIAGTRKDLVGPSN